MSCLKTQFDSIKGLICWKRCETRITLGDKLEIKLIMIILIDFDFFKWWYQYREIVKNSAHRSTHGVISVQYPINNWKYYRRKPNHQVLVSLNTFWREVFWIYKANSIKWDDLLAIFDEIHSSRLIFKCLTHYRAGNCCYFTFWIFVSFHRD
jgi:hypothetical protein